jgi:hypothetical protein
VAKPAEMAAAVEMTVSAMVVNAKRVKMVVGAKQVKMVELRSTYQSLS